MASTRRLVLPLSTLLAVGCAPARPVDPDIVPPEPGQPFLEKLPGPMLGPFDSYSDALLAACRKILTKPGASAGHRRLQESRTLWRVSSEYCAWVYYTPDDTFMVSKLTDQSRVDPLHRSKGCLLPSHVEDPRYPPGSIKYVYALHNHPYGGELSKSDIRYIVGEGAVHGFEPQTRHGAVRLSIIAFFAHDPAAPACDGFHQYVPVTSQLMRWTQQQGRWKCEQTGLVVWNQAGTDFHIKEARAPCFKETR